MSGLRTYGEVLAPSGARPALAASLVGRMSLAMNGLAVLLVVKQATGSYAQAGFVSAAEAVAFAVAAPQRSRAADRRGPAPVLRFCAVAHPLAFVAFLALIAWHAPVGLLALAGAAIGVTVPPLGSVMRALWARMLPAELVPSAYSLESVTVEMCFVVGPLLVAALAATVAPTMALAVSAALGSTGAWWLSRVPVVRDTEPHPARATHFAGPLVSPVVRSSLLTLLFVGASFGSIEVGSIAFVEEHGQSRAVAGVVLALWSFGSMLGGLTYGSLRLRASAARQLPILVTLLGVASVLPALAPGIALLTALLVVFGSTIAPFFACNSVVLGDAAPEGTVTEAFGWGGSMIFGGAAAGTALAGVVIDAQGSRAGLVLAGTAGVLAVVVMLLGLRGVRRVYAAREGLSR